MSVNSSYNEQELSKVFKAVSNNRNTFNASTSGVKDFNSFCSISSTEQDR